MARLLAVNQWTTFCSNLSLKEYHIHRPIGHPRDSPRHDLYWVLVAPRSTSIQGNKSLSAQRPKDLIYWSDQNIFPERGLQAPQPNISSGMITAPFWIFFLRNGKRAQFLNGLNFWEWLGSLLKWVSRLVVEPHWPEVTQDMVMPFFFLAFAHAAHLKA